MAPTRRQLLRAGAAGSALLAARGLVAGGLVGGGLGATTLVAGCATTAARGPLVPRLRVPPMRVGPDREIRTVVGLRPFRPSGFVVRADKLDDKLLVHNYGHGGGGVTLSWGTADLAARLVLAGEARRVAVLGCGAVGLASARLLQERGADVTVYAAALPPETTSNIAGAQWFPAWTCEEAALVPPFRDQLLAAAQFAYRRYQLLVGAPDYGVRWMTNYALYGHEPRREGSFGEEGLFRALLPAYETLAPDRHPFPTPWVRRFETMMIEPSIYLPALLRDVRLAGGRIVVRRFQTRAELAALPEPVVVNCTGLGARELFDDQELTPLKGQLTVMLPQPEIDYAILYGDLYSFARRDGLLLGGTHEEGNWSLEPDLQAKARIVAGHARLHAGLAARALAARG